MTGTLCGLGKAAGSATQQCAETGMLVVAGALGSGVGSAGGVRLGADEVAADHVVVDLQNTRMGGDLVGTLDTTRPTRGGGQALLEAYGGNDTRGALDVATACRAKGGSGHGDFESETFLVQAEPICFSSKDYGADASEIAPTLRAAGHHESHANAGAPPAIVEAYQQQGSNVGPMGTLRRGNGNEQGGVPFMVDDGVAHTLRAEGHDASEDGTGRGVPLVVSVQEDNQNGVTVRETTGSLRADAPGSQPCGTLAFEAHHGRVRRLTPLECERLQGFPDGWTLIPTPKRNHRDPEQIAYLRRQRPELTDEEIARLAADGPRYKAIGNSMAVNVMRWIGVRIENERRRP